MTHDYTGPAKDISAEFTVTEQISLLTIKDNGVKVNQAVKFSIVVSLDSTNEEKSDLTEVINVKFCKAAIERI